MVHENQAEKDMEKTIPLQHATDFLNQFMVETELPTTPDNLAVMNIVLSAIRQPDFIRAANEYTASVNENSVEHDKILKVIRRNKDFPYAGITMHMGNNGEIERIELSQAHTLDNQKRVIALEKHDTLYDKDNPKNTNSLVSGLLEINARENAAKEKLEDIVSQSPAVKELTAEHLKNIAEIKKEAETSPEFAERYDKLLSGEKKLHEIKLKQFTQKASEIILELSTDGYLEPYVKPYRLPPQPHDKLAQDFNDSNKPSFLNALSSEHQSIIASIKADETKIFPSGEALKHEIVANVPFKSSQTQLS